MHTKEARDRFRLLYIKHHKKPTDPQDHITPIEEDELNALVLSADLSKYYSCWICKSLNEPSPAIALTGLLCKHHTLYHLNSDVARWENPTPHLSLYEYSDTDVLDEIPVPETGC